MYKDLLELRGNKWVPRRKEEKAKTLEEIRKDVEREERRQAQLSQQQQRSGPRGDYNPRSGRGGGGDYRGGTRPSSIVNRPRQAKPSTETDADGFTTVTTGSKASSQRQLGKPQQGRVAAVATNHAFAALADEHPPTASSQPKGEPMSKEKLERRIKSMRTDFLADGGNVDELMLSIDELSATPGAAVKVVSENADRIMDCKDNEREAIYRILSILFEKEKLSKDDVRDGLMDAIEFIDSFVMDSPRAFEYLGNLLGDMLRLNAIDIKWLCEQCEKTKVDPNTEAPEKLILHSLQALKASGGSISEVVDDSALSGLLGDDTWKAISQKVS
jgi:translation initiation factor 4G